MCLYRCLDDIEMLGFTMFMLKYTIVFVNGLFVVAGLLLIGFGTCINIPALVSKDYFGSLSIYAGAVTTFVSGSGFFSSFFDSIYGVVAYILSLLLIFSVQAVVTTWFYVNESQLRSILRSLWTSLTVKNRENIENSLSCCGWDKHTTGLNCTAASDDTCWDKLVSGFKNGDQLTLIVVIAIMALEAAMLVCMIILAGKLVKIHNVPGKAKAKYSLYSTQSSPDFPSRCDTLLAPENAYTNFRRSPLRML